MEGLNNANMVVTNRSILDKGFVLKKRCGQIKVRFSLTYNEIVSFQLLVYL
jgi:hypothetical protein